MHYNFVCLSLVLPHQYLQYLSEDPDRPPLNTSLLLQRVSLIQQQWASMLDRSPQDFLHILGLSGLTNTSIWEQAVHRLMEELEGQGKNPMDFSKLVSTAGLSGLIC